MILSLFFLYFLNFSRQQKFVISGHIDIKDIIWPGNALKPPEGIPEKRFIRVSFLEEDPYIMLDPPSACSSNKGSDGDEPYELARAGSFGLE